MKLTREARCWSGRRTQTEEAASAEKSRSFPAHGDHEPSSPEHVGSDGQYDAAVDAFWVFRATVEGTPDPATGYICDIHTMDEWLKNTLATALRKELCAAERRPSADIDAAGCLFHAVRASKPEFAAARLSRIEWAPSPFTRYAMTINDTPDVFLTRTYEFCAAHRLYCPDYSEEENREYFGKCSNPHGHGHNYVVEVTIRGAAGDAEGTLLPITKLDRLVQEHVIEPFDHRNLNVECPEFAALNPSVENIARVIFQRLTRVLDGNRLAGVRVWETAKTSAVCTIDDMP